MLITIGNWLNFLRSQLSVKWVTANLEVFCECWTKWICEMHISEHCTYNQHLILMVTIRISVIIVVILIPILPSKDSNKWKTKCRIKKVALKANDQKNSLRATILIYQLWLHPGPSLSCVWKSAAWELSVLKWFVFLLIMTVDLPSLCLIKSSQSPGMFIARSDLFRWFALKGIPE